MSLTRRVFLERIAQIGGYSAAFRAMQALGLMAPVGVSPLPQLAADFGRGKSVVILGAGIAGLVSAYELRKAGFSCTIVEARSRPGGRNWTVRDGTRVEFTDGTIQNCTWSDGGYLNAGPARIPSIHTNLLNYCQELNVPLEVEVNVSRSALMQSPLLNSGKPVEQRQVIHDTRGYLAELLSKSLHANTLDDALSKEDTSLLLDFLQNFGDLDADGNDVGPKPRPMTPEVILRELSQIKIGDIELATDDGRRLQFRRVARPNSEQRRILQVLGVEMPERLSPDRIL